MKPDRPHLKNYNDPGHAHELTFSCYRRLLLLSKDRTRQWFVESVDQAREELQFDVWAYVIMPEHVHIIIWPRHAPYDLPSIRSAIKEPVGRQAIAWLFKHAPSWITRLTRQRGKRTERLFWQSGGGYDRNITSVKTLMEMIDYIHLNPVRRGLVDRAEDWKWSSARWFLDGGESPLRLDPIPSFWLDMDKV